MAPGLAAAHRAPLARKSRATSGGSVYHLRHQLLFVPWKPARRRQTNASILGNLCVRERLSCAPARSRASQYEKNGLLVARTDRGLCRVLCFSPRHDLTIPRMNARELRGVVDAWAEQFSSLAQIPWVRHVQIFENRGELMGASNPHPHCQIW